MTGLHAYPGSVHSVDRIFVKKMRQRETGACEIRIVFEGENGSHVEMSAFSVKDGDIEVVVDLEEDEY